MIHVPSPQLDEQTAKSVLARAIEIDSQSPTTSIDELRSIALELGVSPAALDAALREQSSTQLQRGNPRAATVVAASGLVLGAAAGVALSTLPLINVGLINIGLSGLGLVASGAILVLQGSAVTLRSFGARNLALWSGYAAGGLAAVAILGGAPGMDLSWIYPLSGAVKNLVSTSILGSAAVLTVRQALPTRSDPGNDTPRGFIKTVAAAVRRLGAPLRDKWNATEMRAVRQLRVSNTA